MVGKMIRIVIKLHPTAGRERVSRVSIF